MNPHVHTYKIYFTDNSQFCFEVSKLCDSIRSQNYKVIDLNVSELITEPEINKKYSNVTIKTSDSCLLNADGIL